MYDDDVPQWPRDLYSRVLTELGSTDNEFVPCDTKTPIVFKVLDRDVVLKPADYLNTDNPDGKCSFIGEPVNIRTHYLFPKAFFRDYCLSVNHWTFQVGIATRRPEKN